MTRMRYIIAGRKSSALAGPSLEALRAENIISQHLQRQISLSCGDLRASIRNSSALN